MPLPTVGDLLSDLGGANVFSTMDLVSGFFQCSIHEDSIPLTAVCTQAGNCNANGFSVQSRLVSVDYAESM